MVDATQGIEAQTISNLYQAIEQDLEIIPVLNKIDLPSSDPQNVGQQIIDLIGCEREDILSVSGKTGEGVPELLEALVERIPSPSQEVEQPLKALIFDSVFNTYRGSVAYVRVMEGAISKGDLFKFMANKEEYNAEEIGFLRMNYQPTKD